MTKKQAISKIDKLLTKHMKALVKDINGILIDAKVWYNQSDSIKHYEDLHKPKDRNADQLAIDFAVTAINGLKDVMTFDEKWLWTEDDIKA